MLHDHHIHCSTQVGSHLVLITQTALGFLFGFYHASATLIVYQTSLFILAARKFPFLFWVLENIYT